MHLQNTTGNQDNILKACEAFGGKATEAVEIVEDLDNQLTSAKERIEELEQQLRDIPST